MSEQRRTIDLSVVVTGTPEQVWEAIASGPGITSWYVPTTVEPRAGGVCVSRFGPGDEMRVEGRVAEWDPPHRVVFDDGEGVPGLAFEWLVEARDGGSCVVRLVNSGFGDGGPWDDQYDAMTEGWRLFLRNLQLHQQHFPGQTGTPLLPTATWAGPRQDAWTGLLRALALPESPQPGERVHGGPGSPPLGGTVSDVVPGSRLHLLLDEPAPGTAFLAAEGTGDQISVSVWLYVHGPEASTIAQHDEPRWTTWLRERSAEPTASTVSGT
ncbi:SRPBCC domain-containing protein [Geodermatophilus sp. TF02-6]|uniref:SRPBCC family protein n=1 Tax=Geodermatophilus sp. TF02-6 TaxID=2250575 RepID=UPI000DE96DB9|nr:SRPBCC domain-containing protein [Geodermatophilus sp. TF02-6]RBY77611.1 SRPBCC domain-containing protein [Geodermatophilus sp. TF02-6]